MDKIDLDQRDRHNIYKEDATNVFAVATNAEELDDSDVAESLEEAKQHMLRTGERITYVVIRIER